METIDMDLQEQKKDVFSFLGGALKQDPYEDGYGDLLICPEYEDGYGDLLICPECGCSNSHIDYENIKILASDRYAAWKGRGSCLVIPIEGECPHKWEICIGYHKGENYIFVTKPTQADGHKLFLK